MIKLSDSFIRRCTTAAMTVGDDCGLWHMPSLPAGTNHYFTTTTSINSRGIYDYFAYSLWIDEDFFYYAIDVSVYACKRALHSLLSIEEMACFIYLAFCKHRIFNL